MDINGPTPIRRGSVPAATVSLALAGLILLVADAIARDQAMMLGGLTLCFVSVTVYFLPLRAPDDRRSFLEAVAWGKLFVAMVYASIAVMFLLVFLRSPEVVRAIRARGL
jgi:hypothetical protein